MLCLNYLNKTVELLFILYNFAIVPSVGTGIKTSKCCANAGELHIVPSVGTGIKILHITTTGKNDIIVPFAGTGIKAYVIKNSFKASGHRTLRGYGD